jgi:cytochrome c oxidase assembly protein subunit 15
MVGWTALAIVVGTVVTGTGPHAGDERAHRFTFLSITWAARLHSAIVWVAILMAVNVLWHLRRDVHDREVLDAPLTTWLCVAIAQGGVGYLQYANGVPAPLVGVHVALGTALWGCSVWLWCATSRAPLLTETTRELRELVDGRSEERAD